MMFFLRTMKLEKFIQEDKHIVPRGIDDVYTLTNVDIWMLSKLICK